MRPLDLNAVTWHKSSYSNSDGGACVEVSNDFAHFVPIRDSKNQHGPVIAFAAGGWASFVAAVKRGELSG
ncbi:DUF397 domain-containing protein [Streptomyces sp. NPDC026659]|uniref:DUF397 domain-containing protein n=1 Tax=Streptomyces sp. NPDC026659 TaxID=3155123 RepID=UPI0033EFF24C